MMTVTVGDFLIHLALGLVELSQSVLSSSLNQGMGHTMSYQLAPEGGFKRLLVGRAVNGMLLISANVVKCGYVPPRLDNFDT